MSLARPTVCAMGRRRYSDAQLADAVRASRNMRQVLIVLGLAPYGGNYETVRRRIAELDLPAAHLRVGQKGTDLRACSDLEIADAVSTSRSLAQVLAKLGIRPGGNQARLRERIGQMELDTSHFVGQGWRTGTRIPSIPPKPLDELLVDGRCVSTTASLRKRLISEGLKAQRCESCLRSIWNDRPISLELDHVNGRREDNRLENLRILCPNCHAQTDTYRGKNIGTRSNV